jgi:hypothetical protein
LRRGHRSGPSACRSGFPEAYSPESKYKTKIKDILKHLQNPEEITVEDIKGVQEEGRALTIWFNAWKYESTEQVWAGLADSIISNVAKRLGPKKGDLFLFQLHLRRQDLEKMRGKIYSRILRKWWNRSGPWIWTSIAGVVTTNVIIPLISEVQKASIFQEYLKHISVWGNILQR